MRMKNPQYSDYERIVKDVNSKLDATEILDYYGINGKQNKDEVLMKCIFHGSMAGKEDRNPSLSVNVKKKVFNCLSCPAKGKSMINFVQQCEVYYKEESCSFHQALLKTCEICKIDIKGIFAESKDRFDFDEEIEEVSLAVLEIQTEVFNDSVLKKFYLKKHKYFENRGFTKETLDYLEMGYGTVGEDKDRCIFPIRNEWGGLVGWTGRTTMNQVKPKWLHRPADRFVKAASLFNIDKAIEFILATGEVKVVESPANVARMIQCGYKNVVALLGNQMTLAQSEMLKNYANTITLLFDPDEGGEFGIQIAIDRLFDSEVNVRIGVYDFGVNEKGKTIDIGEANKEMIDSIEYVTMFEHIENNYKVVDLLANAIGKKTKEIKLVDGSSILYNERLDKTTTMQQVTQSDVEYILTIDTLFGVRQLESNVI